MRLLPKLDAEEAEVGMFLRHLHPGAFDRAALDPNWRLYSLEQFPPGTLCENWMGSYRVDLATPCGFAVADRLLTAGRFEAEVAKSEPRVDTSQLGDLQVLRVAGADLQMSAWRALPEAFESPLVTRIRSKF